MLLIGKLFSIYIELYEGVSEVFGEIMFMPIHIALAVTYGDGFGWILDLYDEDSAYMVRIPAVHWCYTASRYVGLTHHGLLIEWRDWCGFDSDRWFGL